jgi:putative ATP-dependent endonuclease of OLD family
MSILIKNIRISGFRGLKNIEVTLEQTTILTGMNNTGKTSFLKALQLSLGNRQFISQDDFFIQGSSVSEKIIIDLLIVMVQIMPLFLSEQSLFLMQ